MITFDHCVYLLLTARLEKRRARCREYIARNPEKRKLLDKKRYCISRDKILQKNREYYAANRETLLQQKEEYYAVNRDSIYQKNKKYYAANRETILEQKKGYGAANREGINRCRRLRYRNQFVFRLAMCLQRRLLTAVKGGAKSARTLELIGCSVEQVRQHLEERFLPGMTWKNHGRRGWHIDHIRPCASFDLVQPEQQRACFHYTNLQPLWAIDNIRKGDKWPA